MTERVWEEPDDGLRCRVRVHEDGRRVVVQFDRRTGWGWTGTGALAGEPGEVLGWLEDRGRWPEADLFAGRVGLWVSRLALGS